ncbi:hypothetical protein SAMN04487895_101702 [Paenibacillus sophorae]|uniref:Uncharacterized protein n=1 Tax=Paenibacillus sophorae TaxID=1333845 RepID=A0A1H8H044_9BACL|nr:hypothetical protein [Paenibacillus sophorae]QWU14393.1 hypothetical protein KP014_21025 [Paenibacillus sophorae]SEN49410.1 hypothetical protein SAMN04487895_101702 [Paenibacillus sophorae]
MIIKAKFTSVCPFCNDPINIGEEVEWSAGKQAVHAMCDFEQKRQLRQRVIESLDKPFIYKGKKVIMLLVYDNGFTVDYGYYSVNRGVCEGDYKKISGREAINFLEVKGYFNK